LGASESCRLVVRSNGILPSNHKPISRRASFQLAMMERPACQLEMRGPFELALPTGFLQTMSPGADFEAVLNADFVVGELYFRLRAPGTSPQELLEIVSAIRSERPQ
jgi:hypothetical protein